MRRCEISGHKFVVAIVFYMVVAMCDIVHDVETIFIFVHCLKKLKIFSEHIPILQSCE